MTRDSLQIRMETVNVRDDLMSKDIITGFQRRRHRDGPLVALIDQVLRGPYLCVIIYPGLGNLDPL